MNSRSSRLVFLQAVGVLTAVASVGPLVSATTSSPRYAVRGATIHTAAGAPIANGTIVMRGGLIEAIGPGVTVPNDAVVIDGSGLHVYPGLIDMASSAPFATDEAPADAGRGGFGGGGGRGGGGGAAQFANREEAERAKRASLLRPDYLAAANLVGDNAQLTALASAGVTTVLAVPNSGIFKGQSALVNVILPPDDPQISNVGDYRKGLAVIKSPVASHIDMAGRGGGPGYPQALLGTIAFTKQGLHDAQWQRQARAFIDRGGSGPRPVIEPPLDALGPVLDRRIPAAFDANEARQIDRALELAREFNLDPIIVGGTGAASRTAELLAAKARVVLSLNFPTAQAGGGGRGGRGGGGGSPSLQQLKNQEEAPTVAAALAAAGVPFAFMSGGASPADFVRNAGRAVRDGGLAADEALEALTIGAARMAGADNRTGSLEAGKIANVVVTSGEILDGGQVRHVFIDGYPVHVEPPAPTQGGRRGGGGGR
ncbi:MAG TPA: amidohydrolase family protein [Vicinamibacterales bacterium]|nr:amidohydrolase family protein [Vicinamibacterales bacterium]